MQQADSGLRQCSYGIHVLRITPGMTTDFKPQLLNVSLLVPRLNFLSSLAKTLFVFCQSRDSILIVYKATLS